MGLIDDLLPVLLECLVPSSCLCSWQATSLKVSLKYLIGFRNILTKFHAAWRIDFFKQTLYHAVLPLLKTRFTRNNVLTLSLLGANWARARLEGHLVGPNPYYLFQPCGARCDLQSQQSTFMCITFLMNPVYEFKIDWYFNRSMIKKTNYLSLFLYLFPRRSRPTKPSENVVARKLCTHDLFY